MKCHFAKMFLNLLISWLLLVFKTFLLTGLKGIHDVILFDLLISATVKVLSHDQSGSDIKSDVLHLIQFHRVLTHMALQVVGVLYKRGPGKYHCFESTQFSVQGHYKLNYLNKLKCDTSNDQKLENVLYGELPLIQ